MTDEPDLRPTRSEKRRAERAAIDERRQVLEAYLNLADYEVAGLEVAPDVAESLALARRLKPSGARARLVKHLLRRAGDDDWVALNELVNGKGEQAAEMAAHDDFVIGMRDALAGGDDSVLDRVRQDHPDADHQRLRQLVRQARRADDGPAGKGARKKLMKALRGLYPMPVGDETP